MVGLIACAEPADAPPPDATVDDAAIRRPVGAPCATAADCEGLCLADPAIAGKRCVARCDGGCPGGTACVATAEGEGCLPTPTEVGIGAPCGIDAPCVAGARCVADVDPDRLVCAATCAMDADCDAPTRCAPTGICAPVDAPALQCPAVECARADLLCVEGACAASCAGVDEACVDGGVCARRASDGALLCRPTGAGALGTRCVSGGSATCADGLTCWQRAPGDPAAICSRPCSDDCPDGFACRRLAGFDAPVCAPAPFGLGGASAEQFESCAAHGPTDCRPELDCVVGPGGEPVCQAPCSAGCGADAVCDDAGLTPHCRRRTRERIGLECAADADCPAGRCVPADVPYCTAACAPGCPPGFYCAGDECLLGAPGAEPLGAPCADGGAAICASGICATDPDAGGATCTQPCDPAPCPDGFTCVLLEATGLCFHR